MSKYVVLIGTAISLVSLPWPITVVGMLASSIFFPPAGIVFGLVSDVVYGPLGANSFPYGLAWGIFATALGYGVSRFIRTQVLGA